MRQVLQSPSGTVAVRSVPPPACPPGGLLVQNAYSAISSGTERTRVELSQKSLVGKARERPDLVRQVVERARREGIRSTRAAVKRQLAKESAVGYSSAGVVLEVGAGVAGIDPGDRVACCGGGHANHAEIVSVPRNLATRVPDGVPLKAASLSAIAGIALHGIRLADVKLGERVAVVGCGLVGQIACRLLMAAGAEVFALDVDPIRVESARAGGADHGITSGPEAVAEVFAATRGIGVDAAIVTAAAPSNDPLLVATEIARDRGSVVLVGAVPIEFPRAPLYEKELVFRVSRSYGPGRYDAEYEERGLDYPIGYVRWTEQRNMEAVLELQARGRLTLVDLIEDAVPVDEAEEAYARLVGPPEERPRGAIVLSYPKREERTAAPREEEAPRARTEGELRIGLVGPGSFAARVLVPAFAAAGARLELVGGGSGPSAELATRELGFARTAESEHAAIDDPDVDAVVIATRHVSHAAHARRALEAGKHVFCEKPLALTSAELGEVLAAAAASPGILSVGFNRRFSPLMRELGEALRSGPEPMMLSYRVSAGHIDADHWVHDLTQGGGRALGEICHFVDSVRFLAGADVIEVHALGYGPADTPIQARDNLVVTLRLAEGSVGTIVYAAEGSPRVPKERLEVFSGTRTGFLDDFQSLELFGPQGRTRRKSRTQQKGHREEVAAFVDGVRTGTAPISLGEIANVSFATLAIVESLRTGGAVRVEDE